MVVDRPRIGHYPRAHRARCYVQYPGGTTTTGHDARRATSWLTEPSAALVRLPRPRVPTTSNAAPSAASSSASTVPSNTTFCSIEPFRQLVSTDSTTAESTARAASSPSSGANTGAPAVEWNGKCQACHRDDARARSARVLHRPLESAPAHIRSVHAHDDPFACAVPVHCPLLRGVQHDRERSNQLVARVFRPETAAVAAPYARPYAPAPGDRRPSPCTATPRIAHRVQPRLGLRSDCGARTGASRRPPRAERELDRNRRRRSGAPPNAARVCTRRRRRRSLDRDPRQPPILRDHEAHSQPSVRVARRRGTARRRPAVRLRDHTARERRRPPRVVRSGRLRAPARPPDRRADPSRPAGWRESRLALSCRHRHPERRVDRGVGVPSSLPRSSRRVRVLAGPVRARLDPAGSDLRHPAVDRSVLGQERADGAGRGHPRPDLRGVARRRRAESRRIAARTATAPRGTSGNRSTWSLARRRRPTCRSCSRRRGGTR